MDYTSKIYDVQKIGFTGKDGNEVNGYSIAYGVYRDGQIFKVDKVFCSEYRWQMSKLTDKDIGQIASIYVKDGKLKYLGKTE